MTFVIKAKKFKGDVLMDVADDKEAERFVVEGEDGVIVGYFADRTVAEGWVKDNDPIVTTDGAQ